MKIDSVELKTIAVRQSIPKKYYQSFYWLAEVMLEKAVSSML